MNLLLRADAVDIGLHVQKGAAELAYLDPPFGVGTTFGSRSPRGGARAQGPTAYDDRWASPIAYIAWLEARIAAARECLSDAGTMWLHLDHRAVHEAKAVCDRVFGRKAFLGEIIWATGNGARGARRGPAMTHQTLLLYAGGREAVWNARDPSLREPFATTSLAMHFTHTTPDGRRFRERTIAGRKYRYYADEGRAVGSVWTDCPAMVANTPLRGETTGYPTQKPVKLLDRIVRASSRAGSLVVDPFCGAGTCLVAAARLGRSFVGADIGALAIKTSGERLRGEGVAFDLRVQSRPSR